MIRILLNRFIFKVKNQSCKIAKGVRVSKNTIVGINCVLASNCRLSSNVVLGNNVRIGEGVKLKNIKIGDNSMIESGVKVVGPGVGMITLGKECYIGVNNILDTSNNIAIGDYVHIAGPSTSLWCHSSAEMCMNSISLKDSNRDNYRPSYPITIENNVYIGCNCTIYPGVTIRHHSIVAPNSAVVKDVPSNILLGGVPGKEIKKINE